MAILGEDYTNTQQEIILLLCRQTKCSTRKIDQRNTVLGPHLARDLRLQEEAGKPNAKLNSNEARKQV